MKLSAAITAIQSAVGRLGTKLEASTSGIKMLTEIGFFLIQLNKLDTVYVDDNSSITEEAILHFFKSRADSAGVAEQLASSFYKTLTQASSVSDDSTLAIFKNIADQAGFTDQLKRAISKSLADSIQITDDIDGAASILDDQEMLFFKNMTEVGFVSDSFRYVAAYFRSFNDASSASDQKTILVGKVFNDSGSFSEQKVKDFSKALAESGAVVDLAALTFNRPVADLFGVSDATTKLAGLVKQESTSVTDSGSLRSQGYCDFTYFAEDFVGASRTF